jgi:translocation and assembly module TamB
VSPARKTLGVTALLLAILIGSTLWIVATESGTRWLVARLENRLPAELSLGTLHGSLVQGIELESLAWRSATLSLAAHDLRLEFQLPPLLDKELIVDNLVVGRLQLEVSDTGGTTQEPRSEPFALPIDIALRKSSFRNIEFERGDLRRAVEYIDVVGELKSNALRRLRLELRSDWLDLDVSGSGRLATDYPLDINVNWQWKDRDATAFGGRLQASGNLDSYSIRHELDVPLSITTTGTVSYRDATLGADLLSEWTSLRWPLEQGVLSASPGRLRLAGQSERFTIDLDTGVRLDEGLEARIQLTGSGQWTPEPRFDVDYVIAGLDPALLDDRVRGALDSRGTIDLAIRSGAPELALGIEHLEGQLNGQAVDGRAAVRYGSGQTTISNATFNVGPNSVAGRARFGETMQVEADINIADFTKLVADAGGSVRGRVAVAGTFEQPEVLVELQGAELAWRDYAIAAITANARIAGGQPGDAEVTIEGADIGSVRIDVANLALSGRPADHALRTTVRAYDTTLELAGRGDYTAPAWVADLERIELVNEQVGAWSAAAPARVEVSPEQGRLQRTCLQPADGNGRACASLIRDTTATSLEVDITALPLVALPISLPAGIEFDGLINAGLRAAITPQQLTAEAEVALADASFSASYDGERVSFTLASVTGNASFADGRLQSDALIQLADDAGTASASLAITDAGPGGYPLDGRADVEIGDASVFAVIAPAIYNPRGRIKGGLTVAGTAGAPEFVGEIRVMDGAFSVRQTGIDVTDVNVRIAQSQPGQMQLSGTARSGDGELAIDGITRVGQDSGIRSEIWLRGDNFELARLPDWQISVSPSITAIFDNYVTTIVGELAIPAANVTIRDIPEAAQTASPDVVVHRTDGGEPAPRRRIDLHLRTSLGDDIQFSGFGLTTGLEGALQLRGGTHAPYSGQGRLGLVGGRYTAYGQELEIERGNLIFTGPLNEPLLDIRAIRKTADVIAGIQLSGTPSRLQSEVFSDPELGDAEALSYLLTGRPLSNSMTSSEGDTLNKAAFALGLSGAGLITSQIQSQLGLETLTIEGTKEDSRLVAGKRLGDRLLVEYGYGLVDQLGTLLLRYQINDRLILESRTGTVSNLDILYRRRKK